MRTIHCDLIKSFYKMLRDKGIECDEKEGLVRFPQSGDQIEMWSIRLLDENPTVYAVRYENSSGSGSVIRTTPECTSIIDEVIDSITNTK